MVVLSGPPSARWRRGPCLCSWNVWAELAFGGTLFKATPLPVCSPPLG